MPIDGALASSRRRSTQRPRTQPADGIDHATPKSILILEEVMPTLVGFGTELHLSLEHAHDLLICVTVRLDMGNTAGLPVQLTVV
jgi:hypothetical protein